MKKRIYRSICLTAMAAVLAAMLLAICFFSGQYTAILQADLRDECRLLAAALPAGKLSDSILPPRARATLLEEDGTVIWDSSSDPSAMENHLDRPEVQQALRTGEGSCIRYSHTLDEETCYYAMRLDSGMVLRMSRSYGSALSILAPIIPSLCLILVAVLLASVLISARLTKTILTPIVKLGSSLNGELPQEYYEELAPFVSKIRRQRQQLRRQIQRLQNERDTVSVITGNMREGLITIAPDQKVLSFNPSALTLLHAPPGNYQGRSYLNISRSDELHRCVCTALSGASADGQILEEGQCCRIFASPVLQSGTCSGAVVLLMDSTQQEQNERMRRDFSANVSHELKTPLTSISGFAEIIESGMASTPEDCRMFAGRIVRESSRLIALIDDIIRLSRLDEGVQMDLCRCSLQSIARDTISSLEPVAEKRQVSLCLEDGPEVFLTACPSMLSELCFNLCENAIKYNKQGGSVTIRAWQEGQNAILQVRDTGIGISAEHQGRIFERFYRVDKSRSKQTGGTGLGLSIAKHIVERHNGSIQVQSHPGVGTAMTVTLPVQGPPRQEEENAADHL
ncbi:ATP-binding protein [Angelakisella massiliensis]|uniref:ATP-binding protein n=1 Tax=Angelakisella massiliensis TaxID=1871018 RepID=UPI0008F82987|nr:ATP-binding protein [Angelakisella massiliensis]